MKGEAPKRRKGLEMTDAKPPLNQTPVQEMKRGRLKPISIAKFFTPVSAVKLTPKQAKINAHWKAAEDTQKSTVPKSKPRTMERTGIPRVSKSMPEPADLLDMGNFILKGKGRGTDGRFR